MQRTAATVFAILILAGGVVAADPGARAPLTFGAAVNEVALAWQAGTLAAVTQDPGSRTSVPPNPGAPVWFLYSPDGRNLLQDGSADVTDCQSGAFTLDDCGSHATQVALNKDGTRMAVASVTDSGSALLFITDREGKIQQEALVGTVQEVAISDDGGTVAAVTLLPNTAQGNKTRVYVYSWSSSISGWSAEAPEAASDIAVSPDGNVIVVTAGTDHLRYGRSSASTLVADRNFSGTGTATAIANSGRHLSVAGSSEGWLHLYNDDSLADRRELRVRDASDSVTSVALSNNATTLAVGNSAGIVWVYRVDPVIVTLSGLLGQVTGTGSVRDLMFARDGASLAVAVGNEVRHYAIEPTGLALLWSKSFASSAGRLAIDEHGNTLVAGNASTLVVFEARRAVQAAGPAPVVTNPGATLTASISLTNTGNRMETVTLNLSAPANLTATLGSSALRLAPGQTIGVSASIRVPDYEPPGSRDVVVTYRGSSALVGGTVTIPIQITTVRSWQMAAVGPVSLGIQAGAAQAFQFNVTNLGNVAETPAFAVAVSPQGWSAEPISVATLAGGETRPLLLTLRAPAGAAELARGEASVSLTGAQGSPLAFTATVGASFGVQIAGASAAQVTPGNTTRLLLELRNVGNTVDGAVVTVGALPAGWSASFPANPSGGSSYTLPSLGSLESLQVPVDIAVSSATQPGSPFQVTFRAASLADPSKTDGHQALVTVVAPQSSTTASNTGGSNGAPGVPFSLLSLALAAMVLARKASKGP